MTTATASKTRADVEVFTTGVERGRLLFFAKVIGETGPLYTDVEAARRAGHPDILVPPTFLFGLELDRPNPFGFLETEGLQLSDVLHGEQEFRYHRQVHAGETVTFTSRISDRYSKANGSLRFLVRETDVTRGGQLVAQMSQTIVARMARETPPELAQ